MTQPQQTTSARYPPPTPEFGARERPSRRLLLSIATLVLAVIAAVITSIALGRQPSSTSQKTTSAPSAAEVTAAKEDACNAWTAASAALNAARHPFVESPPNWDNPITINALARAQAGALIQVEYLRQHVPSATPPNVAGPIADYIAAAIDTVAADGQHKSAAVANAAAERGTKAAAKIRAACGIR